jgi:hyperosmotically inducible protein
MRKLLLIPAMCLFCAACSSNGSNSNDGVKTHETSADWEITTKVKSTILSDTSISASARFVSVNTTNGVVTLTGNVPTRQDRERIVRMVKKVSGVVRVDDQMTVSND